MRLGLTGCWTSWALVDWLVWKNGTSVYTGYNFIERIDPAPNWFLFSFMKQRDGMSKAHFLASLLFLTGCSSLFVEQPKDPWMKLKQESRLCFMDLKSDRELKAIEDKVTLESVYDRDVYFELLNIEERPTANEKAAIKKWLSKLERCYGINSESYAYEPKNIAIWSAASDSEQLSLVLELSRGNLSYGQFAAKRLEIDTRFRGQVMHAIAADYRKPEYKRSPRINDSAKPPVSSSSSCGWEGSQWVCRSL